MTAWEQSAGYRSIEEYSADTHSGILLVPPQLR
jgi:hypothetical protein